MRIAAWAACAGLVVAGAAWGQTAPRSSLTRSIVASDLQLDAVYLCRDLNADGSANDAGEATPFFDASNVTVGAGSGAVFSMVALADGTVLIGDGDTDAIYALKDLNGDGDTNDAGEALVYFASAFTSQALQTPNGLAADSNGYVYALTAGANPTQTADYVYRLKDMDGNGDANGASEWTRYVDLGALVTNSSAFAIACDGDTLYIVDSRGSDPDTIWAAHDDDGNGTIEANELKDYYDTSRFLGPAVGFGVVADAGSVYVVDSTGATANQKMWKLTDGDGDGVITLASEVQEVWAESTMPSGFTVNSLFDLALGPPGVMGMVSSGADTADNVLLLEDLNHDGDFEDAGETTVFVSGHGTGVFAENLRALRFLPAPVAACDPDLNQDGNVDQDDVAYLINVIGGGGNPTNIDPDFNHDGNADQDDVSALINVVAGGACP